ncbi:UvrD-like DNA helicase, C-terminal [uncultured Caudovirales phage]|uniref:DNA 3'-5' helicase n=1 Tax=uncultured Caudovirales phage TaxID=2100421 RepID=A0A6J5QBR5_9CAUD|nr:UvrD-like DNA helicase, C-terminal [uncultured Caudovirales phage]CAB4176729.1 UvrD-like DNA helicase, C-terminal [uncultured Caudovirales phage]CAB4180952.1 UvrD-like DNA helicase, C-terminal [uncultured Caudovirales phage]CAB4197951.1 UvrD-like DNA helicase, C-terminal [uncultured Caudovirales phage]CAB4210558.1 UvrD-like DNA helicase, C-terminal [uncultured Caudovirales phage]
MSDVDVARIIGGAGTGKTTTILQKMELALDRLGGDPLRLGFASFTRAARSEAVSRASAAWGVSESLLSKEGWFRTIHSTCFRCLGVSAGQLLAGDSKADLEWISEAVGVKVQTITDEDTGAVSYTGDPVASAALNCWSFARSSLRPLQEVVRRRRRVDDSVPDYALIVRMAERYETKKRLDDRMDFNDLLAAFAGVSFSVMEGVTPSSSYRPELPEVSAWLFDEQQDASPLLDLVCKRLVSAPSVKWCYVVGDPFQAIYGFAGSNADCFLGWQVKKEMTMPKSYRCPTPILALGERCLRRMHRGYFDRGIEAADHAGSIGEVGAIDQLVAQVDPKQPWLLIARTKFQASRIAAEMHRQGKPVRWTTSPDGPTNRSRGLQALYKLENGEPITGHDWKHATELLPSNGMLRPGVKETMLVRGTKKRFDDEDERRHWDFILPAELDKVGATPALRDAIVKGEWVRLVDHGDLWRREAKQYGPLLAAEPQCRVGTIHSVKGMEADNVAVLTTTAQKVAAGAEDCDQYDEECRIAYVAVTRTRKRLVVINEGRPTTPRMEVL